MPNSLIWRAIKNNLPLLALQLQEVLESE